jgi:hypothetical protein
VAAIRVAITNIVTIIITITTITTTDATPAMGDGLAPYARCCVCDRQTLIVDGAGEGESGAGALKQPAAFRRANRAEAEQGASCGRGENADDNRIIGAEAVERCAGDDVEARVS